MPLIFAEQSPGHMPTGLLVRHILEGAVLASPEQEIVYRDTHRYSYAQMGSRVHRLASALQDLGVREGSTVAIMDWDSHRYLEAYFAVPMMGAVLQTANVRLSSAQLTFCLRSTGATHLLFHADFAPLVEQILPELPDLQCYILIADGQDLPLPDVAGEYEMLLAAAAPDYPFSDFDENALATAFHTTGTTGNPKMVTFSHRQLVLHTLALSATLALQPSRQGLGRDDVYMPLTPMFHVHAWGIPLVATMIGIKQVYPGRYQPALIVDLKIREGVTFSHCVPTILQMLLEECAKRRAEPAMLSPWTMVIGGSPLSESLQNSARGAGIDALGGFGMSETGPAIAVPRSVSSDDAVRQRELRKAGWPLPLVRTAIVDEAMVHQPHDGDTVGELVLRAPWLTASYPGSDAASADLWRGGWMHTQDVATIAPDGTIEIRDRLKDVIKTGGEWVSSVEVEELLLGHPLVDEAAVIGVPDARWGERPMIFLVLAKQAVVSDAPDVIRAALSEQAAIGRISRYAIPERFEIVAQLPRTSVGKIDKRELRRWSSQSRDSSASVS